MKNMVRILALMFFVFTVLPIVESAPLKFVPQTVKQPDGAVLHCFASGDEYYSWLHDKDGFTIVQDEYGYYVYAEKRNGLLFPTQHIAGRANPSALGIEKWLNLDKRYILDKLEQHLTLTTQLSKRAGISTLALAPTKGTLTNVVVFVRFADETEFSQSPAFFSSLFNNTASAANSVYNYYNEVSYGQLKIQSKFYTDSNAVFIKSYKDQNVRNYYIAYSITNQIGYKTGIEKTEREHALLTNAINAIKGSIPATENLDADNDGNVDNVCFIARGSPEVWSSLLWPHMWSLDSKNVFINGKKITAYNVQLENTLLQIGVGVLCHEMFHSLGAPDLYHYSLDALSPVGKWDLMEETLDPPQHMSAYMKYRYGKWISTIQEISSSGTYYLNPLTSSRNNGFKIASPNSASEYFVLEYRKKLGAFERSLPSEGLLVYRINRNSDGFGNKYGPYDEIYVYRPKGSPSNNGEPDNASLSQNSGRVVLNDYSDPAALLSDGLPGGLDVFNIGAISDSIGFELRKAGPYKLALTSPSGGENFKIDNQTMITWMNQAVSEIKIELTVDGIHWEAVATVTGQAGVTSGEYLWKIPSTPTSTGKIKISDAHDASVYSISRSYFTVSSAGQLFEIEPNNTTSQATPIAMGETYEGEISPEGDADYYRFYATEGDTIDVFANAKNSTIYGRIQVRDTSGFLAYGDGIYKNLMTNQRLTVLIPKTGVYCIRYSFREDWGSPSGSQMKPTRTEASMSSKFSSANLASTTVGRYQISLQRFKKSRPDFADAGAWYVTQNGAVLYWSIQENGCSSKYTFEYGTSNFYGQQIDQRAVTPLPLIQQNTITSTSITSLLPSTTYHFRIKAVNEFGTSYSNDATFTTAGEPTQWERQLVVWESQSSDLEGGFFKFIPFNRNDGILCYAYGLFKTQDGGSTWGKMIDYPESLPQGASFVSKNVAWVVGGYIHKTTDGGATWTKQNKPIDERLTSVYFVDENNGTAVGWQGCIIHTSDGGNHWIVQKPGDLPGMWERLYCVEFCDANHGIAVGTGGLIYTTTNAGATWTKQQSGTAASLNGVHLINALTATVVGDGPCGGAGVILHTTNGGTTWVAQNNPTGNYLSSVDFYDERNGLCVGINGSIARTSDGGITWVAEESGVRNGLAHAKFIDSSCIVISGDGGIVLKTKDANSKRLALLSPKGDETWQQGSVQSIRWQKNNVGKIHITYSTDNGNKWNTIAENIPASFNVYSWLIPNTLSNHCKIRICDADNSTCVSLNSMPFAIIGPGPRLKASVTLLDFGRVGFGRSKDTVLAILNTGDDTLRLSYPSVFGNGFSLMSVCSKIEPRNRAVLGLRYEALAIGEASGLVIFSSNAASSPDTILLKGFGVGCGLRPSTYSMNIGPVLVGRSRDTTYSISNTGNDTLKIASITSTNIVFSVRLTMKNIPPGQSAADTIRYAPNVIGTAIGKLLITSNAPTSPDTVNVSGRGVGVPVLTLAQSSLNIGSVKLGQYKDTTVTIRNTGNDTLKITAITSTNGVFSARPTVKNIPPGGSFVDTIRYAPNVIGTANGNLLITSNAVTSPDTVKVGGTGVGVPVLTLAQSSLNIGSVKLGQYKDTTVTIKNTGNDTLKITAITSTDGVFSARPTVKNISPGQSVADTIRYTPNVIGTASGRILVASNATTSPDTVSVTGMGVGVPVLMLAQSSLNIGSVRLGQYKDTTVTISNTGNDTLKITTITSTNSAFSARPTVKNVPPGGIFVDTIRYAPIVIGTANGNLLITSNDATTPDTMAVTGIGTPVSAIDDALSQIPEEYSLAQNYPNPFNPSTTIRFGLPVRSSVRLTIYNMLGQLVASLVNCEQNAGWHQVRWEATISSGLYIYRLEAVSVDEPDRRFVEAKKMIVIR